MNVKATASALSDDERSALNSVRLVLSAGAPVPVSLMQDGRERFPNAEPQARYGMTEVLPVTDVSLTEIDAAGAGHGVAVGPPVAGVRVAIASLDEAGQPSTDLTDATGVLGEICVAAPRASVRRPVVDRAPRDPAPAPGWHRTGVGHLDGGRLWVEGRLVPNHDMCVFRRSSTRTRWPWPPSWESGPPVPKRSFWSSFRWASTAHGPLADDALPGGGCARQPQAT